MFTGVFPNKFKKKDKRFTAVFYNALKVPVDFYGVDFEGRRLQYTRDLETGNKRKEGTSFTTPWVFKESQSRKRLFVFSGQLNSSVFKGENFGATEGLELHVTINENGTYYILLFAKEFIYKPIFYFIHYRFNY